ncbi:hypothetical protein Tsubulata_035114, partial [Turnera subulata]
PCFLLFHLFSLSFTSLLLARFQSSLSLCFLLHPPLLSRLCPPLSFPARCLLPLQPKSPPLPPPLKPTPFLPPSSLQSPRRPFPYPWSPSLLVTAATDESGSSPPRSRARSRHNSVAVRCFSSPSATTSQLALPRGVTRGARLRPLLTSSSCVTRCVPSVLLHLVHAAAVLLSRAVEFSSASATRADRLIPLPFCPGRAVSGFQCVDAAVVVIVVVVDCNILDCRCGYLVVFNGHRRVAASVGWVIGWMVNSNGGADGLVNSADRNPASFRCPGIFSASPETDLFGNTEPLDHMHSNGPWTITNPDIERP